MQAIKTKYFGPTTNRGSRIKATCDRGRIWFPYPYEISGTEEVHRAAAMALCEKFAVEDFRHDGQPAESNPWKRDFVSGAIPSGEYVHVFLR